MDRSACLDVIHALAEEFEEEFFTTSAVEQVKSLLFQVLDLQVGNRKFTCQIHDFTITI